VWGKGASSTKQEDSVKMMEESSDKKTESDICLIGDFTIDISIIEKNALLSMRLILPADGYKILKNRKNARI
jgi:hypothetical protein